MRQRLLTPMHPNVGQILTDESLNLAKKMNRLAHIDRDGPVAVAPGVIFSGTPSQIVNFPTYITGGVGAITVGVVVAQLRTAYTETIIDTAHIACWQDIPRRQVQSLERDVIRVEPCKKKTPAFWRSRPQDVRGRLL